MKIVRYPHPALRYRSGPVTNIDETFRGWVREMFELMYDARGIGLAANQVGLPFRFFVLNLTADPDQADQEQVFINPEIVKRYSSAEGEEGCLSFPGLYAPVTRAKKIRVQAFDLLGNDLTLDADDLLSRAIQHEADHLAGRLFIDHLRPDALSKLTPKVREMEAEFRSTQAAGQIADDDALNRHLERLARGETTELEPAVAPSPSV